MEHSPGQLGWGAAPRYLGRSSYCVVSVSCGWLSSYKTVQGERERGGGGVKEGERERREGGEGGERVNETQRA